jgi:MraZ protein
LLQGAHAYHIDDKGRLKLPAEFVAGLGAPFTLTKGQHGCLWLLPAPEWEAMAARLRSDSLLDHRTLALQRYFIGSAATLSPDAQARISLPAHLREFAGLSHEVMLVGTGTRVELWSRERWAAYERELSDQLIEELARSAGL